MKCSVKKWIFRYIYQGYLNLVRQVLSDFMFNNFVMKITFVIIAPMQRNEAVAANFQFENVKWTESPQN